MNLSRGLVPVRDEGESGGAYWRRLDAEEQDRKRRQEESERPLLEGRWISASEALRLASVDGESSSARKFLVTSAAETMNNRPMLRTRAVTAHARTQFTADPVRLDRIVHSYEWDGEVLTAFWKTGLFKLKTRHVSGRELTLTGVEFSLDDLEKLIGSADRVDDPTDRRTDLELSTDAEVSGKPRLGRPSTGGFSSSDVPAFEDILWTRIAFNA